MLQNAHIVDIEYPQGICSSIFVVEDFQDYLHKLYMAFYLACPLGNADSFFTANNASLFHQKSLKG